METAHKEALAVGRQQGRIVRRYLKALNTKTRTRRSVDALQARLDKVNDALANETDPVRKMVLTQTRMDLQKALDDAEAKAEFEELENEFKQVVADYAERRGLTYDAFREVGVPASVLKDAGIERRA